MTIAMDLVIENSVKSAVAAPQILVVDDNPTNVKVINAALEGITKNILIANSSERALAVLERARPDLILMDVNMPGIDGYEACRRIKARPETADIPVIFLTAQDDAAAKLEGFAAGGVDYVVKPFHQQEVIARVTTQIKIHALSRELVRERQNMLDSVYYARRIQRALMPKAEEFQKTFRESFVYFKPKDVVSGDFYCYFDREPWHVVVLADCTGHGVPGAFMSIIGMTALNKIIAEREVFDPASVMEELDAEVRRLLCQATDGGNDGMDAVVLAFNVKRSLMYYSAAMRPFYRVRNGEMTEFKADRFPVGGTLYGEKKFSGASVSLEKGDMFYLASDGFSDQFGGRDSKKYMVRNFKHLLQSLSALPAEEQLAALEAEFESWKGSRPQTDDVTVIGIGI